LVALFAAGPFNEPKLSPLAVVPVGEFALLTAVEPPTFGFVAVELFVPKPAFAEALAVFTPTFGELADRIAFPTPTLLLADVPAVPGGTLFPLVPLGLVALGLFMFGLLAFGLFTLGLATLGLFTLGLFPLLSPLAFVPLAPAFAPACEFIAEFGIAVWPAAPFAD